jgi:FkbM family methyltransferase
MLLDFDYLYKKYNIKAKGILHIGAHFGQENTLYQKHGIKNKIFFEPLPHTFKKLQENVKDGILVNKALGNETGIKMMNLELDNQSQSSSFLTPKLHLTQYPWIKFNNKVNVSMIKLDDYEFNREDYNFINIDVQGYELEVFKGGKDTLNQIDYIIAEVNRDEVYENCARVEELDAYLGEYGFKRVETNWEGKTWGDAFYIKNKKVNEEN